MTPYADSLSASWKEGVAASVMIAITDYYLIPLGIFLGGSPFQIGLLVAIPHLLGSISQLLAVRMVRLLGSRLQFLIQGTRFQAAFLLPLAILPFLRGPASVSILILVVVIFRVIGNHIGTVWGSLVSGYLSPEERGSYLGWRSQICGLAGIFGLFLGGLLLSIFKRISLPIGFSVLFSLTALARLVSSYYMAQMVDVRVKEGGESDFTFFQFLARFRESNFVKFVLYVAAITFATHLASPYFSVYMLKVLQFDYLSYMAVHLASVVSSLILFPVWGRHADIVGNARVIKTTSFLVPLIPFLWLTTRNPFFLVLVELFSGFAWCGFNLCSVNFIYDAVSPEKRVRCLSYFNLINGIALCLGASLGGFLAERLPALFGSTFCTLFLLSGTLRFFSHFLLSEKFKEVRESAQKVSSIDLFFSVIGIRPLLGEDRERNILYPKAPGR